MQFYTAKQCLFKSKHMFVILVLSLTMLVTCGEVVEIPELSGGTTGGTTGGTGEETGGETTGGTGGGTTGGTGEETGPLTAVLEQFHAGSVDSEKYISLDGVYLTSLEFEIKTTSEELETLLKETLSKFGSQISPENIILDTVAIKANFLPGGSRKVVFSVVGEEGSGYLDLSSQIVLKFKEHTAGSEEVPYYPFTRGSTLGAYNPGLSSFSVGGSEFTIPENLNIEGLSTGTFPFHPSSSSLGKILAISLRLNPSFREFGITIHPGEGATYRISIFDANDGVRCLALETTGSMVVKFNSQSCLTTDSEALETITIS